MVQIFGTVFAGRSHWCEATSVGQKLIASKFENLLETRFNRLLYDMLSGDSPHVPFLEFVRWRRENYLDFFFALFYRSSEKYNIPARLFT